MNNTQHSTGGISGSSNLSLHGKTEAFQFSQLEYEYVGDSESVI